MVTVQTNVSPHHHLPPYPAGACVLLSVARAARLRPASLASEDVPEAPPACVCCQTQVSPAFASTSAEQLVSPYQRLHSPSLSGSSAMLALHASRCQRIRLRPARGSTETSTESFEALP